MALLLVGFFMVVGTAWVQADPATTQREEAGEVPTDWEVAPREAWSDLTRGRFPHLTWGRTLLGGVVGLSLLFGAAGVYVLATQGWQESAAGPVGAEAGDGLAVLPFTTSGGDLEVYGEGMVEPGRRPDLATSLRAAGATGASHALLGGIVDAGGVLRLTGRLYARPDDRPIADVQVEGPADQTLALVDRFSVDIVRELIGSEGGLDETGIRLASLTTTSIPALESYLEAESYYRQGDFPSALGADMLRDFVERYPDEAEGWYQLSDFLFHLDDVRGGTRDEVLDGFDRAVELGPRFAPYYIHAIESALKRLRVPGGRTQRLRSFPSESRRRRESGRGSARPAGSCVC